MQDGWQAHPRREKGKRRKITQKRRKITHKKRKTRTSRPKELALLVVPLPSSPFPFADSQTQN
jgi:hypothetical protein